ADGRISPQPARRWWIAAVVLCIHNLFHRVEVSHGLDLPDFMESLPSSAFGRSIPRWERMNLAYSPGTLLPSSMFAKRVELCRKARLNLPMGPLRCLAIMISPRPFRSGSSCL